MAQCNIGGERRRLQELHRFEVLDTPPEEAFDRITQLIKSVLQIPMAAVSLVDQDRQWFKSRQGIEIGETERSISFCTHAIEDTEVLIVGDALEDPRFATSPLVRGQPYIRFYAGVPLRARNGHNIGALCAMDTKPRQLDAEQIGLLQDLARLVVDELELHLLATVDSLTGAISRRQLLDVARSDVERAKRFDQNLSCIVIDLDHFKSINDRHGHGAGDLVLDRVASLIKSELSGADYIGRIGGQEFAIMLPTRPLLDAFSVAERILDVLAETAIEVGGHSLHVSASIGVAEFADAAWTVEQLLEAAGTAMYDAKRSGRNRAICRMAGDVEMVVTHATKDESALLAIPLTSGAMPVRHGPYENT
jgi:diguanylate cyclase (GGDEF)-like protein